MKHFLLIIPFVLLLWSCTNDANQHAATQDTLQVKRGLENPLVEKVLTKEEQSMLTPDTILQMLKEGNTRFVNDNLTARLHSAQIRVAASGQYPKAVILSCLDSRIPVEDVFDKGIGDLFVARIAGNIINEDILGSMEFGCKAMGSKLILVLGHTECGAIKGAIDNVRLGNLTALLAKITPAVDSLKSFSGEKTSKNKEYVNAVTDENVKIALDNIRQHSEILRDMEENGEIKIVGAVYDMATGNVTFMQ
jgi:carbonic anhydrase